MTFRIFDDAASSVERSAMETMALVLRLGLGSVFVIGGWWKLSRAIDPVLSDALVARYTAGNGYINAFFQQFLFVDMGTIVTPLGFLTALSAFELLSGLALLAGFLVRSLSLIYAFLLWTFVMALPVITAPGANIEGPSYFSPALLVQIRDIGMSGMFFILFNLGAGSYALDRVLLKRGALRENVSWDALGLLLRLSTAAVFIVGGLFAPFDHIKSFVDHPEIMITMGLLLASGYATRLAAAAALLVIVWYCFGKVSWDAGLWNNLNAIKREIAYLAACVVLFLYQGGQLFRPYTFIKDPMTALFGTPIKH